MECEVAFTVEIELILASESSCFSRSPRSDGRKNDWLSLAFSNVMSIGTNKLVPISILKFIFLSGYAAATVFRRNFTDLCRE